MIINNLSTGTSRYYKIKKYKDNKVNPIKKTRGEKLARIKKGTAVKNFM